MKKSTFIRNNKLVTRSRNERGQFVRGDFEKLNIYALVNQLQEKAREILDNIESYIGYEHRLGNLVDSTACAVYVDGELVDGELVIYVSDDDTQQLQEYVNEEQNTNGRLNSFMLLRTNPKLTGNIKIVVDNEGNLYMDTFKAASVLNNRVYRKYPISSDGNYPHDVMTVF